MWASSGRTPRSSVAADVFRSLPNHHAALFTASYGFSPVCSGLPPARHCSGPLGAPCHSLHRWLFSLPPVDMYFNPSWSHAHSSFARGRFLWCLAPDRSSRSLLPAWLISRLDHAASANVYYPNAIVLAVSRGEALPPISLRFRRHAQAGPLRSFLAFPELSSVHLLCAAVVLVCLLPTFFTRYLSYGSASESGLCPLRTGSGSRPPPPQRAPSVNHGLLAWTPFFFFSPSSDSFLCWLREPSCRAPLLAAFLGLLTFSWPVTPIGLAALSTATRFFVSLTVFHSRPRRFFRIAPRSPLPHRRRAALAAACRSSLSPSSLSGTLALICPMGSPSHSGAAPSLFPKWAHTNFSVGPRQLTGDRPALTSSSARPHARFEDRDPPAAQKTFLRLLPEPSSFCKRANSCSLPHLFLSLLKL